MARSCSNQQGPSVCQVLSAWRLLRERSISSPPTTAPARTSAAPAIQPHDTELRVAAVAGIVTSVGVVVDEGTVVVMGTVVVGPGLPVLGGVDGPSVTGGDEVTVGAGTLGVTMNTVWATRLPCW
jgi:hypothetical protein